MRDGVGLYENVVRARERECGSCTGSENCQAHCVVERGGGKQENESNDKSVSVLSKRTQRLLEGGNYRRLLVFVTIQFCIVIFQYGKITLMRIPLYCV